MPSQNTQAIQDFAAVDGRGLGLVLVARAARKPDLRAGGVACRLFHHTHTQTNHTQIALSNTPLVLLPVQRGSRELASVKSIEAQHQNKTKSMPNRWRAFSTRSIAAILEVCELE